MIKIKAETTGPFDAIFEDTNRVEIIYGGAGSGKSYSIAQKLILTRILSQKREKWLMVRKVAQTLRYSVFALLQEVIEGVGARKQFRINKSIMHIKCTTGNEILFVGLDDAEKLKSIQGITGIWVEEASEITEDDFKQLNLRLRGMSETSKQIILSFNPISELHWLKAFFFDNPKPNVTIHHSTYKDNAFIDDDYKQELENLKDLDPNFYKIYTQGDWGRLEGLIFHNWDVVEGPPERYDEIYYGLDFGYSVHPAALVKIYDVGGVDFYLEEIFYKTEMTNADICEAMSDAGLTGRDEIIADSAEPKSISEIARQNFQIKPCRKGPDSVRAGIDYMLTKKLHWLSNSQNGISEMKAYSRKQDKDGNYLLDPVKFRDHLMDASRYPIFYHSRRRFGIV